MLRTHSRAKGSLPGTENSQQFRTDMLTFSRLLYAEELTSAVGAGPQSLG
jgi:hypothetical protein